MTTISLTSFLQDTDSTSSKSKAPKPTPKTQIKESLTHPSPKDIAFNLLVPDILHQQAVRILRHIIKLTKSKQLPPFLKKVETTGEIEAILLNDDLPKIKVSLSHLDFIKPLLNERYSKLLKQLLTRYEQTDTHLILTYFRIPQLMSIIDHAKSQEQGISTSAQFYRLNEEILTAKHLHIVGIRYYPKTRQDSEKWQDYPARIT